MGCKKMKKILMLGGSFSQVEAIKKAKEMGYYVITCDYLEDNPGHKLSDEYHNVSTIDKEAVFTLAKSLNIDGILCYAADSGAPTVAYVAEKLGLPSFPYKSVEILSNKDMLRFFLKENNFMVPKAKGYTTVEEAKLDFHSFSLPLMVKPVDSSGSRGVSIIHSIEFLEEKVEEALIYSRAKRFIIEEYIEKNGYQIGGDCFFVKGELVFSRLVNNHFRSNSLNEVVPVGESWPCTLSLSLQEKINSEIQRLVKLLNMKTGPLIFEVLIDRNENVYIIDLGVRNNGELTQAIKQVDGVDLVEYTIKAALNEDCSDLGNVEPKGYGATYTILNEKEGLFKGFEIEPSLRTDNLMEVNLIHITPGLKIEKNKYLGTLFFEFSSMSEMLQKIDHMNNYIKVIVEDETTIIN